MTRSRKTRVSLWPTPVWPTQSFHVSAKEGSFLVGKGNRFCQQAERLNDKLPEVHFSLGTAYAAIGQTSQAISELKRALEISPNSDEAYRRLGRAYAATDKR